MGGCDLDNAVCEVDAVTEPKRGDLALCSAGALGLITSEAPESVTYPDGTVGYAWTGVHLEFKNVNGRAVKPGDPWCSRNPQIVKRQHEIAHMYYRCES